MSTNVLKSCAHAYYPWTMIPLKVLTTYIPTQ